MKKISAKKVLIAKIIAFVVTLVLITWLLPINVILANGEGSNPPGSGETITQTEETGETVDNTESTEPPEITEPTENIGATGDGELPQEQKDLTPPIITLIGESKVVIEVGSEYIDEGATAQDDVDGDISGKIEVNSNVDTSSVGTYKVIYNVSDSSGNSADEVTRTVEVINKSIVFNPKIFTDKEDYHPGEEVVLTGTGFVPGEPLQIIFMR